MYDCKCHKEHDAQLVPFCTRCDNDYANFCNGSDYSDWEAEGGWIPKDDTPKRKRNR